jgi:hypothetical protein
MKLDVVCVKIYRAGSVVRRIGKVLIKAAHNRPLVLLGFPFSLCKILKLSAEAVRVTSGS